MGSPGTFGLSFQKAEVIRRFMASSEAPPGDVKASAAVPASAPARRFLASLLADRDWAGLLSGPEWRTAAKVLTGMVAGAQVNSTQHRLNEWADRQGVVGDTALIRLGNQLMAKLDEGLPERDAIGFELSSYALRRTLDELYAEGKSAFDVGREDLLRRLPKVKTETALQTFIGSYLQEIVNYVTGGLPPPATAAEGKLDSKFQATQQEQIPRLARDFLATLREYSKQKYGRTKPLTEMLGDVPEWLSAVSKKLLKEGDR
jgi:hypothetical protein